MIAVTTRAAIRYPVFFFVFVIGNNFFLVCVCIIAQKIVLVKSIILC